MVNSTQGLMTSADLTDHDVLHDTGRHPDCLGHDEADAWGDYNGTVYCAAAEVCPDVEEGDEWGPPPGLEPW